MATQLGNNGNQLADMMHNDGLLENNKTLEYHERIALEHYATTERQQKFLKNDDFWEDFCYRCEELGVTIDC